MTFETMDWEAEARSLNAAFGAIHLCKFKFISANGTRTAILSTGKQNKSLVSCFGYNFAVEYNHFFRSFFLQRDGIWESIEWYWYGHVGPYDDLSDWFKADIAKVLFKAGLLNDKLEAATGCSPSHHQKLEWTLEYEERLRQITT